MWSRRGSAEERIAVGNRRDPVGTGDVRLHASVRGRAAGTEPFERTGVETDGGHGDTAPRVRGKRQRAVTGALRRVDAGRAPDPEMLAGVQRTGGVVENEDENEAAIFEVHPLHGVLTAALEVGAAGDDGGVGGREVGVAQ